MMTALASLALLPADRQSVIILAFWTLLGAGLVVSFGAWILLRRESNAARPSKSQSGKEPAETEPAKAEPAESGPAPV